MTARRMRFREAHYRLDCALHDHDVVLPGPAKVALIRLIQGKAPEPRGLWAWLVRWLP